MIKEKRVVKEPYNLSIGEVVVHPDGDVEGLERSIRADSPAGREIIKSAGASGWFPRIRGRKDIPQENRGPGTVLRVDYFADDERDGAGIKRNGFGASLTWDEYIKIGKKAVITERRSYE
ncbi:MAG: hypothetical protein AABW73_02710 [Nanoarchaeota archaeon]